MEEIIVRTSRKPYGLAAVAKHNGIRLIITNILGAQCYVAMPRAVAEALRDEMNAALSQIEE
jgi:hypothetical protein